MGLGFAVLAAAAASADGADVEKVAAAARDRAAASSTLFYVDTLDYLRRGGRIGAAQALFGQALAVKPILAVVDGRVAPLEKVRTTSRALARLAELAVATGGRAPGRHRRAPPRRAGAGGRPRRPARCRDPRVATCSSPRSEPSSARTSGRA